MAICSGFKTHEYKTPNCIGLFLGIFFAGPWVAKYWDRQLSVLQLIGKPLESIVIVSPVVSLSNFAC